MKQYNKEVLKDAANRLLFDMSENEYETLLNEFDIMVKQMNIIGSDSSIDEYEPMVFPFDVTVSYLRDDVPGKTLTQEEALRNAHSKMDGQVKLPKVVK